MILRLGFSEGMEDGCALILGAPLGLEEIDGANEGVLTVFVL